MITDGSAQIERLREREKKHFGARIEAGGDMHQNHMGFIEYATAYDTGDINMRSKAKQSMMSGKIY